MEARLIDRQACCYCVTVGLLPDVTEMSLPLSLTLHPYPSHFLSSCSSQHN